MHIPLLRVGMGAQPDIVIEVLEGLFEKNITRAFIHEPLAGASRLNNLDPFADGPAIL